MRKCVDAHKFGVQGFVGEALQTCPSDITLHSVFEVFADNFNVSAGYPSSLVHVGRGRICNFFVLFMQVRRLVLIDAEHRCCGIVTLSDVFGYFVRGAE